LARGAAPNFGVPCNISATAGVSDFKFGARLHGVCQGPSYNHTQKKGWAWPSAGGASQNLVVPFNIYTMAEASDFKCGTQLGFAKAHHKIPH